MNALPPSPFRFCLSTWRPIDGEPTVICGVEEFRKLCRVGTISPSAIMFWNSLYRRFVVWFFNYRSCVRQGEVKSPSRSSSFG